MSSVPNITIKKEGELVYTCNVCGISFPKEGDLKKHMMTTHRESHLIAASVELMTNRICSLGLLWVPLRVLHGSIEFLRLPGFLGVS